MSDKPLNFNPDDLGAFDRAPDRAPDRPPAPALRQRLAIALREVDLLRRLIRAAESVRPHPITTADRLPATTEAKGGRTNG